MVALYSSRRYEFVCRLFISRWVLAALGKTDFVLYGWGGEMTVMAVLASTMRQVRDRIAAVESRNTCLSYAINHIQ